MYDDEIQVLEGLEAVRKRPQMYVGPVDDPLVANQLLQEAMCLALDEACGGHCSSIDITLHADGSASVADDGRGLSLATTVYGRPKAEVLMTALHACRHHKSDSAVGDATCNVGIAVMNALSEWCILTTAYEGKTWRQSYRQGAVQGPFEAIDGPPSGTTIRFKPDATILVSPSFQLGEFVGRIGAFTLSTKGTRIRILDERAGPESSWITIRS